MPQSDVEEGGTGRTGFEPESPTLGSWEHEGPQPQSRPLTTPSEHACCIPKVSSTLACISNGKAKGRPGAAVLHKPPARPNP